mmetsp:Transcript_23887/g.65074  ORF Transcript_23887/g.65074 Transcript_23887/m.65074 type:complete len:332 (-) Transcript_23887:152-1147(-)
MSSTTRAATSRTEAPSEKPLVVLTDPHWNFDERTKFDVEKFFEEAKITTGGIEVLQSRFDKFSSVSEDRKCVSFLSFGDFCRMNKYYGICKSNEEEHFFRTMDQQGNGYLCFQDFLLGCAAASPNTPHVLNSYTGLFRARYIFDYYNASRSGTLDYEELACLLSDTRRHLDEAPEVQHTHALEMAQDLGDVSVTTLRVSGLSGPLCDLRVSTRWTGLRVRRELARELQVPVEGQELLFGHRPFPEEEVLDAFVPIGTASASVTLVRTDWERWPCAPEPSITDGLVGLERLVHVTFERFYGSLIGEQLRGTSRLFRIHRPIMHSKKSAMGGA